MSNRRPAALAAASICAVAAILLGACDGLLVNPAPAGSASLAVSFSMSSAMAGDAQAFDRADGVRIRLQRRSDGSVVFDDVVGLSPAGGDREASVEIELLEDQEALDLSARLLSGGQALFEGATSVTVRSRQTTDAEVPLLPIVAAIQVSLSQVTLTALRESVELSASALFATGDTVRNAAIRWESDDPSVASVSSAGLATSRAEGETQIRASAGAVSATVQVRVQARVVAVTVTPARDTILVGDMLQLSAVATDANNNALVRTPQWQSSDQTIARVDNAGLVSGLASGQATITATVEGQTGSSSITVMLDPVETVTVLPSAAAITVGDQVQFRAELRTHSGTIVNRPITWTTSDARVASVDGTGLVEGLAAGTATITATSEGVSGSAQLTVNPFFQQPTISNFQYQLTALNDSSSCSNNFGSLYTKTFDYSDPGGQVTARTSTVKVDWSFQPGGNSGSFNATIVSASGPTSGVATFRTCTRFGNNTQLTETITLIDDFGQVSNSLTSVIPRPIGANGGSLETVGAASSNVAVPGILKRNLLRPLPGSGRSW